MMSQKLVIAGLLILLIGSTSYLYLQLTDKEQEINKLKTQSQDCEKLELNYQAMKQSFETMQKPEKCDTSTTQAEIDKLKDKLNDFELTVKKSMEWFTQNSNINNSEDYGEIKEQLLDCIKTDDELCKINLECIYETNKKNQFIYRYDHKLTGDHDKLKSLATIYEHKGGDCEDLSFLFKAEYNYLTGQCETQGYGLEKTKPYVAKGVDLGPYMYVVCGAFDPQRTVSGLSGHCVVAMTTEPITDSTNAYWKIKDAILVEPQTGEYICLLNNTRIIKVFNTGQFPDTLFLIDFILTDDDFKIFYTWTDKTGWTGYSDFLEETGEMKTKIGQLENN